MKIPSTHRSQRGRGELAMTPLIDVVFLLLVFFVWTASFQVAEQLLPSQLLTSGSQSDTSITEPLRDLERVIVRIVQSPAATYWVVNGTRIDQWPVVQQRLADVASIRTDVPVVVDPDDQVPLGEVILVYDTARQHGFDQVQFATDLR